MSVYTTVDPQQLEDWLAGYSLGSLVGLKGIAAGITNTNYFVTTTQGRYVLTLFEALALEELPYYLALMSHLARHGVACPTPVADNSDRFASMLAGKPACLVSCLDGADTATPSAAQCRAVGAMQAALHKAGDTFTLRMKNPRGPRWWSQSAHRLYPLLTDEDRALLKEEIQLQDSHRFDHLPSGVIHADLFRDNVLLKGDAVAGFIDFYYACNDILLYDVAIAVNDWARREDGTMDDALARAYLEGYRKVRPLTAEEEVDWPVMLRAGALRFWVSRLLDLHFPQAGELTFTKDPNAFRDLLLAHRERRDFWL